ncbi:hypothetical protein [Actinokineospora spheciospongiae]|uniref:hypothetical protein n=1 Tax=Actinokineospora spheciospongiae TaxID=909613 RepID=UPI000D70FC8D|nr:hypothetical protein [Actinokineospora spheciospongiae]
MHAKRSDGSDLIADFTITPSGDTLTLVIEAAGPDAANPDYVEALTTLLRRLSVRDAEIVTAETDTRVLLTEPIALDRNTEPEKVRMRLTGAQSRTGDNRQRMRLALRVPDYGPDDADRLLADLAAPPAHAPRAVDMLTPMIGISLTTVGKGKVNRILDVSENTVVVSTASSPDGQSVPVAMVQAGLDLLWERGSVRVGIPELGHRSSFVGAVLAALPVTESSTSPPTVVLSGGRLPVGDRSVTALDVPTPGSRRVEQGSLRLLLLNGRDHADCALCGHVFPKRLLVAAHIKQRAQCTDDERLDLVNVAMLACSFGCDSLYELGLVTVGADGVVRVSDAVRSVPGRFAEHLDLLGGRRCTAHRPETERYFAWHRDYWAGPGVPC